MIDSESDYHADDADQWVQVERYIRGEIQDLGGATKANAHVKLPDGRTLKVTAERDVLKDDTVNRLYKIAMLRIKAEYNVLTRDLRNARLVEFVEYAPKVDEDELARLTRRGANAWKDVPDATAWVDELRQFERSDACPPCGCSSVLQGVRAQAGAIVNPDTEIFEPVI